MLKRILKACIQLIAKDYWNGWLYVIQPTREAPGDSTVPCAAIEGLHELTGSPYEEIRSQAWSMDADAWLFGAWADGKLAAICWVQARATYRRRGGVFDLREDEAELAQITTAHAFRGRGIATELIRFTACQMEAKGFRKLYAKIWYDNRASVRAFERAGWKLEKRFFSLRLRSRQKPLIFRLPMPIAAHR